MPQLEILLRVKLRRFGKEAGEPLDYGPAMPDSSEMPNANTSATSLEFCYLRLCAGLEKPMHQRTKIRSFMDLIRSFFGMGQLSDMDRALGIITGFFWGVALFGLAALSLYVAPWRNGFSPFGFGLLVSGGSVGSGFLVGFLFGMPRESDVKNLPGDNRSPFHASTSLEQIADWLTKIIVGIGIAEFRKVIAYANRFTNYLDSLCVLPSAPRSFGIIFFFAPPGFLLGYFYARTFFLRLFSMSESPEDDRPQPTNPSADSSKVS